MTSGATGQPRAGYIYQKNNIVVLQQTIAWENTMLSGYIPGEGPGDEGLAAVTAFANPTDVEKRSARTSPRSGPTRGPV
jgi:hypothetical protein